METDDDVLAAALAFIDDAFALSRGATTPRDEINSLRCEIGALVATLDLFCDGSNTTALWMQVANSQSDQREEALHRNKRLREAVEVHASLARSVLQKYRELVACSAQVREQPTHHVIHKTVEIFQVPVQMRERLHYICDDESLCRTVPRPTLGSRFQDCNSRITGETLEAEYGFAQYYPFKLSLVSDQMWQFVSGEAKSTDDSGRHDDELWGCWVVDQRKPIGRVTMHGRSVARRSFARNGDVIFHWSALSFPLENQSSNLMTGLRTIEDGWMRVSRVEVSSQRAVVYVEANSRVRAVPISKTAQTRQNLERLRDFMVFNAEGFVRGLQGVENRLFDAALANASQVTTC